MTTRLKSKDNTSEEIERGKEVGRWIRKGLAEKGWKIIDLHRASGVSKQYLGLLANKNGINTTTGVYQRPGEEIIEAIATALEIDVNAGRRAGGYGDSSSPQHQELFRYTIGEFNGKPVVVTLSAPISDEQLEKMRFAATLTLAEYGGS